MLTCCSFTIASSRHLIPPRFLSTSRVCTRCTPICARHTPLALIALINAPQVVFHHWNEASAMLTFGHFIRDAHTLWSPIQNLSSQPSICGLTVSSSYLWLDIVWRPIHPLTVSRHWPATNPGCALLLCQSHPGQTDFSSPAEGDL